MSDGPILEPLSDLVGGAGGSGNGLNAAGDDGQVIVTLRRQTE
ncbi:MAG: hypothetical protein ACJAZO_002681 [Myxococcota bacterium]|jgi:hypothetical protein